MVYRIRLLISGLVLVTTLFGGFRATKAQSRAPYLYYYSQSRSAFIVERADGSDSRVLAPFVLPDGYSITGPGWSPSGRWFAWTLISNGGMAIGPEVIGGIVSRDGKHLVDLSGGIESMAWSPSGDLLLIKKDIFNEYSNLEYDSVEYDIFNPESVKVVLPIRLPVVGDVNGSFMVWTPNGRYAAFYYELPIDGQYIMELFAPSGIPIATRLYRADHTCFGAHGVFWSGKDTAAYLSSDGKTLYTENFIDGSTEQLPAPSVTILSVDWSPNGEYALIYTENSCLDSSDRVALWLLSLPEHRLLKLSDNVNWLYPWDDIRLYTSSTWSRNGNFALFLTQDLQLNLVTAVPFSLEKIAGLPPNGSTNYEPLLRWSASGDQVSFAWTQQDQNSTSGLIHSWVYSYQPRTRQLSTLIPMIDAEISYFAFSSDGRYRTYSDNARITILDMNSGKNVQITTLKISLPDVDPASLLPKQVLWHPQQDWLLVMGYLQSPWYAVNVINADGTVQRDLGVCILVPSCFGWLPDEALTF